MRHNPYPERHPPEGVSDRLNEDKKFYGTDRLLQQFGTADSDDPAAILKGIIDDLSRFAGHRPADDDQAMLIIVVE